LKKLLNVALLLERGLKISKIAGLSPTQLSQMVAEGPSVSDEGGEALAKQRLKLAMMTFDEVLFRGTMEECVDRLTFDGAVLSVALPFLAEVGVLWLTDTICPAHEHFMSNLLRQMLFAEIHNAPIPQPEDNGKVIVLYLPEREIHDISLLFLHHLCRSARRQSVFLGQSVPFDDLVNVAAQFDEVCFVSYCTTSPAADQAQDYVDRIDRTFTGSEVTFHLGGGVFKQATEGVNTTVHTDGASLVQKILH
jgi:methanogenic corrinoid protein MtbC1